MAKKSEYPCHEAQLKKLNRVNGQVQGIKGMIEERRYCPDILMQLRAARAALKSIEAEVMATHLNHCVREAVESGNKATADEKISEIRQIFEKYND